MKIFLKNFESVLSYSKKLNCDLVIHGGDLFFRSKVPEPIVDRVYKILSNFANSGIPIYIVPGNHERSRLPTSLFLNHPLIHIFNQPRVFSTFINRIPIKIGGFPFIRGDINNTLLSILERSDWYKHKAEIKVLAFHQAIEGATVGPGNFTFRRGNDVLSISALPNDATVVLCGHIHRQQVLTKKMERISAPLPIIFSGSTERTSFAEKDERKGFYHLIIDLEGINKWRLKESRFIELPTRPMRDIYIDPNISAHLLSSYLEQKMSQIDPNSIVRFNSHKPINSKLTNLLTTKNLNQWLPPSINFTFGSRFFAQNY